MVYMNIIICEDLSPRRRVLKHPFYTFDRVDPETCYIYYTVLKQDLHQFHRALGLDALGGSIQLENGMEFDLILLTEFDLIFAVGGKNSLQNRRLLSYN